MSNNTIKEDKNLKPSAIERELDVVVIVNNIDNAINIENKVHSNIINKKIRKSKFIKLNRIKNDKDLYNEINDIISTIKGDWCDLNSFYLSKQLYLSDFIIFINDGKINENEYKPLCIAYIKLYDVNKYRFLYISALCSNRNYGGCGSKLMDAIKYLSSLLECSEIILDSIDEDNTKLFYKNQKFIYGNFISVPYHNFKYIVSNKDKNKIEFDSITGNVEWIPPEKNDNTVFGGKSKRRRLKKKKKTIKNYSLL